jgi:hypothetical protein
MPRDATRRTPAVALRAPGTPNVGLRPPWAAHVRAANAAVRGPSSTSTREFVFDPHARFPRVGEHSIFAKRPCSLVDGRCCDHSATARSHQAEHGRGLRRLPRPQPSPRTRARARGTTALTRCRASLPSTVMGRAHSLKHAPSVKLIVRTAAKPQILNRVWPALRPRFDMIELQEMACTTPTAIVGHECALFLIAQVDGPPHLGADRTPLFGGNALDARAEQRSRVWFQFEFEFEFGF